jgi:hypothetical protein
VPVTVRSGPNPLLAVAGSPFANRFGITPGDIRKQQIAAAEQRRKEAEENQEGGFDDAFGGMSTAWLGTDFGIGDKRTKAYEGNKKWNEALTFVPTPAGARAQAERRLGKKVVKEGAEKTEEQVVKHADDLGRQRRFWTRTHHFEDHRVYQRDDLIDVARTDEQGRSSLQRMKDGLAPLGPDGKPVELHHTTQRDDGALAEVSNSFHKQYSKELHVNPNTIPSGIDRTAFKTWKRHYWMHRAEMLGGGP